MLPWPSRLSVRNCPEIRLRHWSSSRYLRISLLHREFQSPLQYSSKAVLNAVPELSSGISHPTCPATYAPFTPNESEQRLRPLYYRGCWHRVSRCFFCGLGQDPEVLALSFSSPLKVLYNPQAFFTHAASLDQGFPHCPIFPTAASRRSLGRVSVPVWLVVLSDQLRIVALVGRYPTN